MTESINTSTQPPHAKFDHPKTEKKEKIEVAPGDISDHNLNVEKNTDPSSDIKSNPNKFFTMDTPHNVTKSNLEKSKIEFDKISEILQKLDIDLDNLHKSIKEGSLNSKQIEFLIAMSKLGDKLSTQLKGFQEGNDFNVGSKKLFINELQLNPNQNKAINALFSSNENQFNALFSKQELSFKKDLLKKEGFTNSEINLILALSKKSTNSEWVEPKSSLPIHEKLGFSESEYKNLLNFKDQKINDLLDRFFKKSGFTKEQSSLMQVYLSPEVKNNLINAIKFFSGDLGKELSKVLEIFSQNTKDVTNKKTLSGPIVRDIIDIMAVLTAIHEFNIASAKNAREMRSISYDAVKQEILSQANEMKKSAESARIAGFSSASFKIASGGIQMTGAAGTFSKTKIPEGASASAKANIQASSLQSSIAKGNSISQMLMGIGEGTSAQYNYQATMHQAKQKEHEAAQRTQEYAAQSASEFLQVHREAASNANNKLDEQIKSFNESIKTIIRG